MTRGRCCEECGKRPAFAHEGILFYRLLCKRCCLKFRRSIPGRTFKDINAEADAILAGKYVRHLE